MRVGVLVSQGEELAATIDIGPYVGADCLWTNQHPGGWDPMLLLPALAAATAGFDTPPALGTAIVATSPRHPVVMATEALTATALTGRPITLGVGPSHGWYVRDQLGLAYDKPASHTREYLEVLRPLLRGEHVAYRGEHVRVDTRIAVRAPAPAVLLAALGPRMLATARDLADGAVAVWVRPDTVANLIAPALGPGQTLAVLVTVAVTDDPDAAREAMAGEFGAVSDMPAYRAVLDRGGLGGPADSLVAGDAREVHAAMDRFAEAGVTDLIAVPYGPPAQVARTLEVVLRR